MRRLLVGIAAAALLVGSAACGAEPDSSDSSGSSSSNDAATTKQHTTFLGQAEKGDMSVRSGWVAATMPIGTSAGAHRKPMSAGYAEISNSGRSDRRLVGASSPASARIELHETVEVEGSAGTMKPVDHIVVPAGGSVTLQPGGYHLMIMDLHRQLRAGSKLEIDLRFAGGEHVPVEFSVIDRADRPDMS